MNPTATITIDNDSFRIGRLDAMRQFHLTRRLLPILAGLGFSAAKLQGLAAKTEEVEMMEIVGPVMEIISKMADDEVEYVIKTSLSVVQRQQGDRWAALLSPKGEMMFADLSMPTMIRLTIEVIKENLTGFFDSVPGGVMP